MTTVGMKRLKAAIRSMEMAQNNGAHFTLEELSDRMNVSTKTLSRLWSLNTSVDQRTLKLCFNAFDLELCREDYAMGFEADEDENTEAVLQNLDNKDIYLFQSTNKESFNKQQSDKFEDFYSYPDGPVPLDSPLYIERPPIEKLLYQEVTQPGSVIRIRAPRNMGKSSLVLRLLAFAQQHEYYTVKLDCYQIDSLCMSDLNLFFRSFCWRVAKELGIDPNLDANWDDEIGSKLSCNFYFQNYLLKQIERPIVLILEQIDRFFEYPQIAQEFFPLLRSWYEEARRDSSWQKLRIVVVYSTEVYVSLDINRSPFNVGLPLRLPEFTHRQVLELAQRHGLNWFSDTEIKQLMSLVGGHPLLIRIALYSLCCQGITIEELLQEALANGGIYRYHLWRQWATLQENASLLQAYANIVAAKQNFCFSPMETYKLDSLGLIRYDRDRIIPRCELYRAYFEKQLAISY